MPEFIYQPEGADPRVWQFEPNKMMSPEAEAIERLTEMTFLEWGQKLVAGSMLAARAFVYVMLKRATPTLKFDEVQICTDDFHVRATKAERVEIRTSLEEKAAAGKTLTEDEADALAQVIAEDAEDSEGEVPKEELALVSNDG